MGWTNHYQVALLLADPSPTLRRLTLLHLLNHSPHDPEVRELEAAAEGEPLVSDLFSLQQSDGSWNYLAALPGVGNPMRATALALMRLGYLGFEADHPAVAKGAEYLFARQRQDGSWGLPGSEERDDEDRSDSGTGNTPDGYAMMPLQTALPLRALAACGFATDKRAERAYSWLLAQRLEDGAWPTGIAKSGVYGRVAGYRRLPHSRWGCRANTTGALICLALHPERRSGSEAREALDLLLGRETREASFLGFEVARLVGVEPAGGFTTFYARFDMALLLDLCSRVGVSQADERFSDLVSFVYDLRGDFGLWEYSHRPQVSRWVTFDLLSSLARLTDADENWVSLEPRTPFQPYPQKQKRY